MVRKRTQFLHLRNILIVTGTYNRIYYSEIIGPSSLFSHYYTSNLVRTAFILLLLSLLKQGAQITFHRVKIAFHVVDAYILTSIVLLNWSTQQRSSIAIDFVAPTVQQ